MATSTTADARLLLTLHDLGSLTAETTVAPARERLLSTLGFRLFLALVTTLGEQSRRPQTS